MIRLSLFQLRTRPLKALRFLFLPCRKSRNCTGLAPIKIRTPYCMFDSQVYLISTLILFFKEKTDFDNKAFELEDIDITNLKNQKNPFDRTERPGSMISVKSNASTSSRSSVNCATGRIRCPNMRLKKFFSYKSVIYYFFIKFVFN